MTTFGRVLEGIRINNNLTIEKFATQIQTTETYLTEVIEGKIKPSENFLENVIKVCKDKSLLLRAYYSTIEILRESVEHSADIRVCRLTEEQIVALSTVFDS